MKVWRYRWITVFIILALTSMAWINGPLFAADHADGSNVKNEPIADIADFFIFSRLDEQEKKRLSLILAVYPDVPDNTLFSDAVNYRFRLRPIVGFQHRPFKANVADQEYRVDCQVSGTDQQTLDCELKEIQSNNLSTVLDRTQVKVNDLSGGSNPDFKIFAGPRADQLFTDRARVRMPVWYDMGFNEIHPDGTPEWPGVNSDDQKNVLNIVVDLDIEKYIKSGPSLFAAVSETALITKNGQSTNRHQIDRMGRVEITVFMVRENEIVNNWNADDTFDLNPSHIPAYREELQRGLARLDRFELSLEGKNVVDWPTPHPWLELLLDDFLIVDLNQPVQPSSSKIEYLDIEIAQFTGNMQVSGGGRVPNEDVIDRTLTYFINGPVRPFPSRGVGVPRPARPSVDEFPFAPPPFQ